MAESLWEPYVDALKLILTGSTSKPLSDKRRGVFMNMLAKGLRDKDGNLAQKRNLPGVQTTEYCTDEEKQEYQTLYYIPDVFRFMIEAYGKHSIHTLPVNLDYLNSLKDVSGDVLFSFGGASNHQEWLDSPEGKEYWASLCRRLEIFQELNELDRTHHEGDPLKLKVQKDMRTELNDELAKLEKKLAHMNQKPPAHNVKKIPPSSDFSTHYIAYPKALKLLSDQLEATPDEIAAWVFMGPEDGGLAAYLNANEVEEPVRFFYDINIEDNFDYLITTNGLLVPHR